MINVEETATETGSHIEAEDGEIDRESIGLDLLAAGTRLSDLGEENIKIGDRAKHLARSILRDFCVEKKLDSE